MNTELEDTGAFTEAEQWVIDMLSMRSPLDTVELRSIPGSLLPRGLPGHHILAGLEDRGVIMSRLETGYTGLRTYSIVEEIGHDRPD